MSNGEPGGSTSSDKVEFTSARETDGLTENQRKALNLFNEASTLERQGKIGDALIFYQRAYRIDPDVESLVRQAQRRTKSDELPASSEILSYSPDNPSGADPGNRSSRISLDNNNDRKHVNRSIDNDLVSRLYQSLSLTELRSKPSTGHPKHQRHISTLPREILIFVLKILVLHDPISIEKFSCSCLAFYRLARDRSVWKAAYEQSVHRLASATNPSVSVKSISTSPVSATSSPVDYRQSFLDLPRVRFDGAFISQCNYLRQGISDGTFSQPIHTVTYYRYLRMFSDGTAIHMLSNYEPAMVIHRLLTRGFSASTRHKTPSFKDCRILTGRYQFDGITRNLLINVSDHSTVPANEEQFHLELRLTSTHPGGWNKLKWTRYFSINGDETTEYSLHNFRSFIFSRVKSFL